MVSYFEFDTDVRVIKMWLLRKRKRGSKQLDKNTAKSLREQGSKDVIIGGEPPDRPGGPITIPPDGVASLVLPLPPHANSNNSNEEDEKVKTAKLRS